MTGEGKAELRQILNGFDLNAIGMVAALLTLALLGAGAVGAVLLILMRL